MQIYLQKSQKSVESSVRAYCEVMQSEQVAVQPGVLANDKSDKWLPDCAGCWWQEGSGFVIALQSYNVCLIQEKALHWESKNRETSGDSKNAFLHCKDVLGVHARLIILQQPDGSMHHG